MNSGRGGGRWSQHLGRASYVVPGGAEMFTRIAEDGHALNRIALPHLDEEASALSARAPKWVMPAVRGDLRAGFVALVSVDHALRSPKVLLRSEPVPETVPTRVAVDLDLVDVGFRTEVTARWDVGVQLPLPGVASFAFQPVLGVAVERLLRAVVDGLAAAATDASETRRLHASARPAAPLTDPSTPPAATRPPRDRVPPLTLVVPGLRTALEPDAELDALLDEVIQAG